MATTWPQPLQPVTGPLAAARIDGAAAGMGDHGPATQSMIGAGLVAPDLICETTLFLLANQPRPDPPADGEDSDPPKGAPGVAGGVWVRERFTIHRSLSREEAFRVTGEAVGRQVHKGRRFATTASLTVDAVGRPVATNLTTGLLSYDPDPDLVDSVDGQPVDEIEVRGPDHDGAAANPHLPRLSRVAPGDRFGGDELVVSLDMMVARDTDSPDNPIHSDPEEARRAGLAQPIASGSHVLAFALEPLLAAWGVGVFNHGAAFDVRWRLPTEAGAAIVPLATVRSVGQGQIVVDLQVDLAAKGASLDSPVAMVGRVIVPTRW